MNPEELPAWAPFLKRALLLRDLAAADLEKVALRLKPLSLPKGATLYSRGDAGDALYLITSGQVRLLAERGGREAVTALLGRGDAVGELSLLTGEPRSVTVQLDTTAEFLVLSKQDFEEVLRENPSILLHLSRIIAQRMLHSQRTFDQAQARRQEVVAAVCALDPRDRELFAAHLAIGLAEQTRRRVLLVDMGPDCGSLARSLGLKPVLTSEAMLRESDLRDPRLVRHLAGEHPSGLSVMSLPPATLGGRLYRGIFLLVNLLRELHDFVLFFMGPEPGDAEKSILEEADQWVLAGSSARWGELVRLEAELGRWPAQPAKRHRAWLGAPGETPPGSLGQAPALVLPWPAELGAAAARGTSPFEAMEPFPRSQRSVRRLSRRVGGLSVGLAMGSGAALGYSLIGVLKGLKRAGVEVDMVTGTSIGGLIAGLYALGLEPEEIEDIATRVDKTWVYENLFWDLTLPRAGIFAGTTLLRFIRSYFGDREFHELELPFACVATDIETGEGVVLREGRVAEAIRASCGIPLLFTPFHHQGRYLVDGGLVDPVPVRVASQLGADVLLSVNLTLPASRRKGPGRRPVGAIERLADAGRLKDLALAGMLRSPNMLEILFQTIYTMEYEVAQSRLDMAHVVLQPELGAFAWTEMHRAREIVDTGERAVEEALPKIKSFLPYFADYCKVPLRPSPWKEY